MIAKKKNQQKCISCSAKKTYKLVKTGLVDEPGLVMFLFFRYCQKIKTKIRNQILQRSLILVRCVYGNSLYLRCSR